MVRYIKSTDRKGNVKNITGTHLDTCKEGYWLYGSEFIKINMPIFFVYADDEDKMLRSSYITNVRHWENTKEHVWNWIITTENSVYYFEEDM